ncbi:MAG TPA: tetratricopeptide repeat protein [Burkholderiales bacterium]|nr:tetratricopeptide repeat protein [Burkholderiales bacterium]
MRREQLRELVARGVALHQAGRLGEAEALYRQVLEVEPQHAAALTMLGTAYAQRRDSAEAARLFEKSLEVDPFQFNALYNRGIVLAELKRFDEALASYDRALALKPDHPEILNNRGNALAELKRLEEALASYNRALAIKPDYPEALLNRGMVLSGLGRHEAALSSFDRALAVRDDDPRAHFNRANALTELRRHDDAVDSYDRSIALDPANPVAFNNRGNALAELCRHTKALESYDRALALKPDYVEALINRGIALAELKRYEEALESYERAVVVRPDSRSAVPYVEGSLECARLHLCDWSTPAGALDGIVGRGLAGEEVLVPFDAYIVKDSAELHYRCAHTYAAKRNPASPDPVCKGERYVHDRIRLAYVSFDFREHVMAHQIAGAIEHHDRTRFETTALSLFPGAADAMRDRLYGAFERFVDVSGRSDLDAARLIRGLEVDILVDLTGYTRGGRMGIFARRPAPIQVNFNCPGTTGADYFDYIITDRTVAPPEHHPYFSERVVYLPDTFQAYDSQRRIADRTPSRSEAGLPDQGFVFCSFNNSYKFRAPVFDIWMRLLNRFEGSVLWLRSGGRRAADNLRREAAARGVDPARLVFAPFVERMEDHLARLRLADLFLDTLPYNAQTTAGDALWAGLPVLTCLGGALPGRVAASLLKAIGLPELVTRTLEEYESLAIALAGEPERLRRIREKLARNRLSNPLFNTARFTRHLEAAYEAMYRLHKDGESPRHFSVTPLESRASYAVDDR